MKANERAEVTNDQKCKYNIPWHGECGKETINGEWCIEHSDSKCVVCGDQAVKGCGVASSLICGAHLCENKKCYEFHNKKHYE